MATPPPDPALLWHALDGEAAQRALQSDAERGLSSEAVRERLLRFGANALPEPARRSAARLFLAQLASPLIYLLLVATAIALALGHWSDAAVISCVVLLNAVIGFFQEGRAERALAALRKLATRTARVIRDGQQQAIEARALVPGDLMLVEAGDAVCADARLLEGAALQLAEAALTGESLPVNKELRPLAPGTLLADRTNMIYAGTHVTAGRARAVVTATGAATEIGHIAALAEKGGESKTPLELRVAQFGRYVIGVAVAAFVAVLTIGFARGIPLGEILMIGISQLVGVIPEGLPVAMTIALAVGVQRMARRKAVVRRLSAVETLGSTTVICTDKTGTLTRNEMTVAALVLPGGRTLTVSGAGYEPSGEIVEPAAADRRVLPEEDPALGALLEAAVLCNDARLTGPYEESPPWRPLGDPTEVALVVLAIKAGLVPDELRARAPRRAEIPFDAAAKLMATQHEAGGRRWIVLKGAPEEVIRLCGSISKGAGAAPSPLDDDGRQRLTAAAQRMAEAALRVLAFAVVEGAGLDEGPLGGAGFAALQDRATFLGLAGQLDPPRPEAKEAVARCRAAGIRPVMVTGDHKATARAIAAELGIARQGEVAVDGAELEAMSEAELAARISSISVFARVHPAQKLRIVEALQRAGEVVAMTGDGVNDAPALVKADVGVAMGQAGTEVAKEAAKIVISDDNFASIVAAVEEGRLAYRNIKKVVLLLFSTSIAEVMVLLLAMLAGYPPPFAAVQILWNNLVTEGLITVNLVMEPAEGDEMRQRPTPSGEPLITREMVARLGLMVAAIVTSTLGWFIVRTAQGIPEAQVRTETFTLLAICEWFNVLNCRAALRSAFPIDLLRNRWLLGGLVAGNLLQVAVVFWAPLGAIFYTTPFGLTEVVALGAAGSLVLWAEELRKAWARRRTARA